MSFREGFEGVAILEFAEGDDRDVNDTFIFVFGRFSEQRQPGSLAPFA